MEYLRPMIGFGTMANRTISLYAESILEASLGAGDSPTAVTATTGAPVLSPIPLEAHKVRCFTTPSLVYRAIEAISPAICQLPVVLVLTSLQITSKIPAMPHQQPPETALQPTSV